jgi:hypothetical protein
METLRTIRHHLRYPIFRITSIGEALWEAYGILAIGFVIGFVCCWIIIK